MVQVIESTLLELQSRLGDKLLRIWLLCPHNGTAVLRPMALETRGPKVLFQIYCLRRTAGNLRVPPQLEKREKKVSFFSFFPNSCRRRNLFFLVVNCQHADRNQLVRRLTLDLSIDSAHGQPA